VIKLYLKIPNKCLTKENLFNCYWDPKPFMIRSFSMKHFETIQASVKREEKKKANEESVTSQV
jgi:hypothetical protein